MTYIFSLYLTFVFCVSHRNTDETPVAEIRIKDLIRQFKKEDNTWPTCEKLANLMSHEGNNYNFIFSRIATWKGEKIRSAGKDSESGNLLALLVGMYIGITILKIFKQCLLKLIICKAYDSAIYFIDINILNKNKIYVFTKTHIQEYIQQLYS